jgi:hypothetical protein
MYHNPDLITSKNLIPLGVVNPEEIGSKSDFGNDDVYVETVQPVSPKQKNKYNKLGGEPIIGSDGKKITFSVADVTLDMVQKDEGGELMAADKALMGAWSGYGDKSPTPSQQQLLDLDYQLKKISDNPQSWHTPSVFVDGKMARSFFGDHVGLSHDGSPTQSVTSAELFGNLKEITTYKTNEEGNIIQEVVDGKKVGILAGVKDVGAPGINVEDFMHEDNFNRVTEAMFNPGNKHYKKENTGAYFREYKKKQALKVQTDRWNQLNPKRRVPTPNEIILQQQKQEELARESAANFDHLTKSSSLKLGPSVAAVKIKKGELGVMRQKIEAGMPFPVGNTITMVPNKSDGSWLMTRYDENGDQVGDKKPFENSEIMIRNGLKTNDPGFQNLKQFEFTQAAATEGNSASVEQISYMVDKIWEPHTPSGYNAGQNAKALKSYLESNFATQMKGFYQLGGIMDADGEYITIKKKGEDPKKWGGDSTGGRGSDRKNINDILEFLGLKLP